MGDFAEILSRDGRLTVAEVPEGYDALLLRDIARAAGERPVLHVAREDARLALLQEAVRYFDAEVEVITFPAWDCLPYDRVSPHGDLVAQRMAALRTILAVPQSGPRVILTTVNAALQRIPPRDYVTETGLALEPGLEITLEELTAFLQMSGYERTSTVTEPGEFAIRGGIVDLFPPASDAPVRLDFFGDELDSMRHFDPLDQRSTGPAAPLDLVPASEIPITPQSIRRFRQGYVAAFGAVTDEDPLYEAVSEGRLIAGAEHWLPLFHEMVETLFDIVPSNTLVTLDQQVAEAAEARFEAIDDYYAARRQAHPTGSLSAPYKPLGPDRLYLTTAEWSSALDKHGARQFTAFRMEEGAQVIDLGVKPARDFAPERHAREGNIYDHLKAHLADIASAGKKTVLASYSRGSRERLMPLLEDHAIAPVRLIDHWNETENLPVGAAGLAVLRLEHGFTTAELAVISEQDILGDRLVRKSRRARRAENFIAEASALAPGDLVVHLDHGVGRYEGLVNIDVSGAPHDCVWLTYAGGDKLYIPVENIEVLSRYGSEDAAAGLDKLGGSAWQARKAKLKARVREMADELIKVAAARALKSGARVPPPDGLYEEFAARFPYDETEDQSRAIDEVLGDLVKGRPMDRLICGDVGFGKTEVALRAAFIAVMNGLQVAVIAPTTLLARQHYTTFTERFAGYPVEIGRLSRLVGQREAQATKAGLADGSVDIVIGTHALLGKTVRFKKLGLVVVDEEQHFGVAHKERLKRLRAEVHVLTLTATPIPRTLQLALSGVQDLSLIATPPVDRLAVRTFVTAFDEVVLREALLREHYRGGQSFFVVPRIADLEEIAVFLKEHVPEVKFVVAHGQMAAGTIDDVMNAFYEGRYDVLVSTTIVESGLDIPTANTLIVHKADMFGLSQLYQLRGRVGRAKLRAYAYLTLPAGKKLTAAAQKRLEVLQALDTLGAGFSLASHDMDIRGAGNLLGEEQSGHIREVGIELYQQMLEEAVAAARGVEDLEDHSWSPQINLGTAILIPEDYVADLNLRMALYRRIAALEDRTAIDALAAEMIDRFGPLPREVEHLLKVIEIKQHAKAAGIEKIEAGAKGITVSFRNNAFANPAGLVAFLQGSAAPAKLRPDHRLVILTRLDEVEARIAEALKLARGLARAAHQEAA